MAASGDTGPLVLVSEYFMITGPESMGWFLLRSPDRATPETDFIEIGHLVLVCNLTRDSEAGDSTSLAQRTDCVDTGMDLNEELQLIPSAMSILITNCLS